MASRAQASTVQPTCRTVVLNAEKDYGPPVSHVDGTASTTPAMRFDVPRSIAVTTGKSGCGTVTLRLHNGSHHGKTYTYRSDCDDDHRRHGSDNTYRLEGCFDDDGDFDHDDHDATADSFLLHVAGGDVKDPAGKTAVTLTLVEEGDCQPPAPDAGPPDAGPPQCTTAAQCDDANVCTVDACTSGACTHTPAAASTACDDGNSCTTGDACSNGSCVGTTAADGTTCDDSMGCTSGGTCAAGKCSGATALADGTSCGSTDLCVYSTATCAAGKCAGTPDCGGVECTSSACMASTGACSAAPAGTPCSTGVCDGNFNCVAGTAPSSITAAPICLTQPWFECNAAAGSFSATSRGCVYAALAAGTTCSSGVCDGSGNCVASASGAGTGSPLVLNASCPTSGSCTAPGSIDFATGACEYVNLLAGTACGSGGHCDGNGACGP